MSSHIMCEGQHLTEEFRRSPRESMRRGNIGATCEERQRIRSRTQPRPSAPILEARLDQGDANQHDGRSLVCNQHLSGVRCVVLLTSYNGWENTKHHLRRCEGEENLEKCADGSGPNDGTIAIWTWERRAVSRGRAVSIRVHLSNGPGSNRDD